jgi:hypothetical protein
MNDKEKPEPESEGFTKFKLGMPKILSVRKAVSVEKLPKMFRERVPDKKARKKKGAEALSARTWNQSPSGAWSVKYTSTLKTIDSTHHVHDWLGD